MFLKCIQHLWYLTWRKRVFHIDQLKAIRTLDLHLFVLLKHIAHFLCQHEFISHPMSVMPHKQYDICTVLLFQDDSLSWRRSHVCYCQHHRNRKSCIIYKKKYSHKPSTYNFMIQTAILLQSFYAVLLYIFLVIYHSTLHFWKLSLHYACLDWYSSWLYANEAPTDIGKAKHNCLHEDIENFSRTQCLQSVKTLQSFSTCLNLLYAVLTIFLCIWSYFHRIWTYFHLVNHWSTFHDRRRLDVQYSAASPRKESTATYICRKWP